MLDISRGTFSVANPQIWNVDHLIIIHVQRYFKSHHFRISNYDRLSIGIFVLWNATDCVVDKEAADEDPQILVIFCIRVSTRVAGHIFYQNWHINQVFIIVIEVEFKEEVSHLGKLKLVIR